MSDTLRHLIDFLRRSGMISEAEASSIRDGSGVGTERDEADVLAEVSGHLTDFQKSEVMNGKADSLILGDYLLILDRLGQGGMGQVFKARHTLMKREVAVKFTLPTEDDKSAASSRDRFMREVETASKLSHPNIVSALDAGHRGDLCYLVMEYVRGQNLNRLVRTRGPMSFPQTIDIALQVSRGLAYSHQQGVVHRDIKPSNLLLRDDGVVKILDMGLARIDPIENYDSNDTEKETHLTRRGQLLGTVDFMAPEQAENPRDADGRADIYSLGCTVYFLLTSKPPYRQEGKALMSRIIAHRETPIPTLSDARGDVPEWFEEIFRKMMAKTPRKRYQNVAELIEALESAQERVFGIDDTLDETVEIEDPPPGRQRLIWSALLLIAVAGGGGWYLSGHWRDLPSVTATSVPEVIENASLTYNLLEHLNLRRDVLAPPQRNRWSLTSKALVMPPGDPTAKLKYRVTTSADFHLEMDVSRTKGLGPLAVGLYAADRQFLFLIDRAGTTLLLTSEGKAAAHIDQSLEISDDQITRLEFYVQGSSVTVVGNGATVLTWNDISLLDQVPKQGWTIGDEQAFLLGSNNQSGFEITRLILKPYVDEAEEPSENP